MCKRMNRRLTWLGFLLVAGLVVGAAGAGIAGPRGDRDGGPPRWERMFERLDLTDEQMTKVKEILAENRESAVELRKEELRLRNQVHGEMLADSPDTREVGKLVRRLGEIHAELHLKRLEGEIAVRSILTDEQRDRLLLHRERMGRHEERMGRHRDRMGCHEERMDCYRQRPGRHGPGGPPGWDRPDGPPKEPSPRAAEPSEVD